MTQNQFIMFYRKITDVLSVQESKRKLYKRCQYTLGIDTIS